MSNTPAWAQPPVVYEPAFEILEPDEAQTTEALIGSMLGISQTVAQHEGRAFRSVHAKSHGILHGCLEVLSLPPELAQGLFAAPATYPVVMRCSTIPGDLLEDAVSTPRGIGLKVFDVRGERLDPQDGLHEQDFLWVNAPEFRAATVKQFLRATQVVAATTDRMPTAKKVLSTALRGVQAAVEKVGVDSVALKALGGQPATHPLSETYYTQVPQLHGPYMAKYALVPVSAQLQALQKERLDLYASEHALREAMNEFCLTHGGTWELRAQLCVDLERMPIEDASIAWSQTLSPFVPVARLTVKPQVAWDETVSAQQDAQLSFNPWRGLTAHRPLGSIMRARRSAYVRSAEFRQRFNSHAA